LKKTKRHIINPRIEKLKSTGKASILELSTGFPAVFDCLGTIKGIRDMHEFQASINEKITYRRTSTSRHSTTFSFR
jgi:hypothetical protein